MRGAGAEDFASGAHSSKTTGAGMKASPSDPWLQGLPRATATVKMGKKQGHPWSRKQVAPAGMPALGL